MVAGRLVTVGLGESEAGASVQRMIDVPGRFPIWRLIPLAAALAGVLSVGVAAEQSDLPPLRDAPVLASGERFVVVCALGGADQCAGRDAASLARGLKASLDELDKVRVWFDEMKFPQTRLARRDSQYGVYYGMDTVCGTVTLACNYRGIRSALNRVLIMPKGFLGEDAGTRIRTLAHELAHAGNIDGGNRPIVWQDEAVASAVGAEWGQLNGHPMGMFPPQFELDLDVPFHEGGQEGYEKWDYFHHLASLSAPGGGRLRFGYLTPLFDYRRTASHPMVGVYGESGADGAETFAGDLRFDRAFPAWVAKYNHEVGVLSGNGDIPDVGYYYRHVNRIMDARPATVGESYELTRAVQIEPFAAATFLVNALPVIGASRVPDKDRLVVVEHRVVAADRPSDIQLVFEHVVARHQKHRYLVRADESLDAGFVRLTNAGVSPAATAAQTARLTLSLSPVQIELPKCIESGRSAPLRVTRGSLDEVGNFRIEASAGRMDGLTFHAPAGRRTVRFHAVIDSVITRSANKLSPTRRPAVRVELGETEVGGECMIRVRHNKGMVITYTPDGDYSQYQARGNLIFFRPGGELDVWSPGSGWADPIVSSIMRPILGGASAGQIIGQLGGSLPPALDIFNAGRADGGAVLGHMPLLLTEKFSFQAMTSLTTDDGTVAKPEDTQCPIPGTSGCVRLVQKLQGEPIITAFDAQRRLTGLAVGEHMFVIDYGSFEIRRPPGW